ncbi:MAG: hypothetical protein ABIJ16_00580 [Bacteroidota bacterium]
MIFHTGKHHLHSIKQLADSLHQEYDPLTIRLALKNTGGSVTDIYSGELLPEDICSQLSEILLSMNCFDRKSYKRKLKYLNNYLTVTISDGSAWTLINGDGTHYIHIHPARNSCFSIRMKSSSLKTAILFRALGYKSGYLPDINIINGLRKEYLGLSPVKKNASHDAIITAINLICDD